MELENYKQAKDLVDKIDSVNYQIKIIEEQMQSNNDLIRFGGQFNVSHPIKVNKNILNDFCNDIIELKKLQVQSLEKELKEL